MLNGDTEKFIGTGGQTISVRSLPCAQKWKFKGTEHWEGIMTELFIYLSQQISNQVIFNDLKSEKKSVISQWIYIFKVFF